MPLSTPNYTADDYWGLPEGVRAELIDGELWDLASPSRKHQEIVSALVKKIGTHIDAHNGSCKVYPAPFAVNLFADDTTFVEPDVTVVCDRSKLSAWMRGRTRHGGGGHLSLQSRDGLHLQAQPLP